MKHPIGNFIRCTACLLCIASLCGCWNSRELNKLGIVLGVGIDQPEDAEGVQVTVQLVKPGNIGTSKDSKASSAGNEAFWNVTNTGDTAFTAFRNLTNESSRKLFFPHNEVVIFGKNLAEEGVSEYIDFFTRDPEPRLNVWVLVSESQAGEILDVTSGLESMPADNIAKLVESQANAISQSSAVRLRDFIQRLMSQTTAPVATMIEVTGEGEQKTLRISGTAVFKKDRLVGKLDKTEGRGLLWGLGKIQMGLIEVEGPDGKLVTLEIIRANGKVEPDFTDGRLVMKIDITAEGNIGEYTGSAVLLEVSVLSALQDKMSRAIRNEVMAAVEKGKELEADIFGFGDAVYEKYPEQWKQMKDNWDETFQTLDVEVSVDAKLRLMGEISNPAMSEQE